MIIKVWEHEGWNEKTQDYTSRPSAVMLKIISHKKCFGFIFFHIVTGGNILNGNKIKDCIAVTDVKIYNNKIKKEDIINQINKYIIKYNKKYNTCFSKVFFDNKIGWNNYEI